jgi:UDP-N-acetylglucosamine 3-dehydrogenase
LTGSGRQVRAAVIGAGAMGQLHVRALLGHPDVDSLALVDPDPERRELLVARHGRIRAYPALADALAGEEELDLAVVAVPIAAAAEVIARLLEAGVAVLAEKPLARTAAEARELAQQAVDAGTLLSVGYIERFNPAVEALRAELARGDAGAVYHVHARRLSPFPHRAGMAGVAIDVATHDIDALQFVTGMLPERVYAETDRREGDGAEDLLCASLRYATGVTGLIESNWLTPMKVRRLTVTTERGMYDLDYLSQDLWLHERARGDTDWEALGVMRGANEGRTIRFALDRQEPLTIEHARFIEAIRAGGPPPVPASDAVETLVIAEAIIESGSRRAPVAVSDARRRVAGAGGAR